MCIYSFFISLAMDLLVLKFLGFPGKEIQLVHVPPNGFHKVLFVQVDRKSVDHFCCTGRDLVTYICFIWGSLDNAEITSWNFIADTYVEWISSRISKSLNDGSMYHLILKEQSPVLPHSAFGGH